MQPKMSAPRVAGLWLLVLASCLAVGESKMRGFNFNGYIAGPLATNVPSAATYGRVMDISPAGVDPIGAPWWGHLHLGPGVYNWTALDIIVAAMRQENPDICLLFPIWGTPTWLASDQKSCVAGDVCSSLVFQSFPGSNSLPVSIDHWKEFITALVNRYSVQQGVFYAYEIWNEPTNMMFLNHTSASFTSKDWQFLAEMQYEAHSIIKTLTRNVAKTPCLHSTDPSLIGTYVLAPSLIFDNNTHMVKVAGDVLQGFVDEKAAKGYSYWPMDAMTCHVYNTARYDQSNLQNVQARQSSRLKYLAVCSAELGWGCNCETPNICMRLSTRH